MKTINNNASGGGSDKHTLENTYVDIKGYTSTPYIAPADGYVQIGAQGSGATARVYLGGSNAAAAITAGLTVGSTHYWCIHMVYVRKDTSILVNDLAGTNIVRYFELK